MRTKRLVALLLCVVMMLTICGCGSKAEIEYASQEDFLRDMAKGISARLKHVDDEKERTDEELFAYYEELVGLELEQIEKYEGLVFEDELFNDLAHAYIDGCQMQRIRAENYKNSGLLELWNSAGTIRGAIIIEMYSRYGLPITAEEASHYATSGTNITYSFNFSTRSNEDRSDCVKVEELPIWVEHFVGFDRYHYGLEVTNKKAEYPLEITLSATFYDKKGNIVGSDTYVLHSVGKGVTQYCDMYTDGADVARAEFKIDQAIESLYVCLNKETRVDVSEAGNKVILNVRNNSSYSCDNGFAYCVFYSGKDIVDVDIAYFTDAPIQAGGTRVGEMSTNKKYTSYELYYDFYSIDQ